MRFFVRYLLLLLIAALSLQGVAAAAMACHDDMRQASALSHPVTDDVVHSASAAKVHCSGGEKHPSSGSHGKCSQCASCCLGAAAPPAMETSATAPHLSTTVVTASEPAMIIYVPAALERPPRHAS